MPGETRTRLGPVVATLVALAATGLSLTSRIDTVAEASVRDALRQALVAYASARALNGAISVAQGSELAVSPAGVGVTLTLGQILDPVNDLVERFSWVVLLASASLGGQLLLSELLSQAWVIAGLALVAGVYVVTVWTRPDWRWPHRLALAALFVRFVLPCTMLLSDAIGGTIISERQSVSIEAIALTNEALADEPPPTVEETGTFERLQRLLDQGRELVDVETWVEELRLRAEEAIAHLIDLITLFLVQTIVLPLTSLAVVYGVTRQIWRRI